MGVVRDQNEFGPYWLTQGLSLAHAHSIGICRWAKQAQFMRIGPRELGTRRMFICEVEEVRVRSRAE